MKTALCPHKKCDINFEIPETATNVRLVHPDLYIWKTNDNILEEVEHFVDSEDIDGKAINIKKITRIPTFQKIWNNYYYKNNGVKPLLSRSFPPSKLINIIWEVFNARYVIEEDPFFTEDERLKTFSETFYSFVYKKYIIDKISKFVLHDIIQALQINESLPIVTLFSKTLSGEEDCSWKYYYILSHFIRLCNNFSTNSTTKLFKSIYPIKTDAFYEELEFDYQSFCKGKSTKDSFLDYILFLIKKQTEPNYLFFLEILHRYDHQKNGYLEFSEYVEFVNQMIKSVSYNSIELQYRIAEQVYRRQDSVPLEKLAYITCYLYANSAKQYFAWNFSECITKEYINHSNAAYLDNISIDELNRMLEKSKMDAIDSGAVEQEMEKMSERVDQMLRKDGIDMEVVNECIKNGQPLPSDVAESIIRREIVKSVPSNTNLKVKERVREILDERGKNKIVSDESSDEENFINNNANVNTTATTTTTTNITTSTTATANATTNTTTNTTTTDTTTNTTNNTTTNTNNNGDNNGDNNNNSINESKEKEEKKEIEEKDSKPQGN